MAVIEAVCRERRARLWVAASEGLCQVLPERGGPWSYPVSLPEAQLALRGSFQRVNARVALATLWAFRQRLGREIPVEAVQAGLRTARWPGRLEVVGRRPWLVLDGAHNVDSARALRRALREEFAFRRLVLVVGFSKGHDVAAFAREIGPEAGQILVTRSRHPRAADPRAVAEAIRPAVTVPVEVVESVPEALARARGIASREDLICFCGSLFVVAAAREALGLAEEVD